MAGIRRRLARSVLCVAIVLLLAGSSGCDRDPQSVRIVAQDFRFRPDMIRLSGSRPIHLTLYNEGREFHEFDSALFTDRSAAIESLTVAGEPTEAGPLRIAPGRRLELVVRLSPGTYVFFCKVKGHAGMTGTLLVE